MSHCIIMIPRITDSPKIKTSHYEPVCCGICVRVHLNRYHWMRPKAISESIYLLSCLCCLLFSFSFSIHFINLVSHIPSPFLNFGLSRIRMNCFNGPAHAQGEVADKQLKCPLSGSPFIVLFGTCLTVINTLSQLLKFKFNKSKSSINGLFWLIWCSH